MSGLPDTSGQSGTSGHSGSEPAPCRVLIESAPNSGIRNMAIDEVLLETALATGQMQIRWYRWDRATLSLGYFQPEADPLETSQTRELPRVRRLSGGGAILHHHEWTCSFALPPDHPLALEPGNLYEAVHRQIVAFLNRAGVPATMRRDAVTGSMAGQTAAEPFLCFGRGDPRDIVLHGHKIVGSAQRRRKGAVLQHGSLLLDRSPAAPEFPGIRDLVPGFQFHLPEAAELAARFLEELTGQPTEGTPRSDSLTAAELLRVDELATSRYARLQWHRRANRTELP